MKPIPGLNLPLILVLLLSIAASSLFAKEVDEAFTNRLYEQLALPWGKGSLNSLNELIDDYCGKDLECKNRSYHLCFRQLEKQFDLEAIAEIGEDWLVRLKPYDDQAKLASVHYELHRFYGALGDSEKEAEHLYYALQNFRAVGNDRMANYCEFKKIQTTISLKPDSEAIPVYNKLLKEMKARKDTSVVVKIHKALIYAFMGTEDYNAMFLQINDLENYLVPNPVDRSAKHHWISAYRDRGYVYEQWEQYDSARFFYKKALQVSEEISDKWLIIYVSQYLASMEWKLKNAVLAQQYLDRALLLADSLGLEDLLVVSYDIKAQFAEEDGRYQEALEYIRKREDYERSWQNRSSGSKGQNHFLEIEKRELQQAQKKAAQRTRRLWIMVLGGLVFIGVLITAYLLQRRQRNRLAAQNSLIQEQSEKLKSLDQAKSRFFANVSHELRTPLTLLTTPVRTLLDEEHLSGHASELLRMANKAGTQLERLVNEILDLQKMETGKLALEAEATSVATFFRTYCAQFESLAARKSIDFQLAIKLEEALVAEIDREKCRQILFNLLSNAFKFTPEKGQILVNIIQQDSNLILSVADTGPGIHPDDIPNLFDRYFQTNQAAKPAAGGTGIGLAICKEYLKLMNGSIRVESELEKGTRFIASFPIVKGALTPVSEVADLAMTGQAMPDAIENPNSPTISEKQHVLVVEDNPDLQDLLRLLLSQQYQVEVVGNGELALENLNARKQPPHLILSDLMMPVMDGFQLLRQLKADDKTRHIPTIMLTARAEMRDKLTALRIGIDDYLVKPFDKRELLVRIENLLNNQRNRMANSKEAEPENVAPSMSQEDQEWLKKFEAFIRKHLSNTQLSATLLAYEFAMSESTLLRQLKRLTGQTPAQYLREIRLDEGRRLLENRRYNSIAQVASSVGYGSTESFSRSFKQRFGKLPSEMVR